MLVNFTSNETYYVPVSVLDFIMTTLDERLDPRHLETLASRLWCFAFGSSSMGEEVPTRLIKALSDPEMVKERLVESLEMTWRLVHAMNEKDKTKEALELVQFGISQIDMAMKEEKSEVRETMWLAAALPRSAT